MINDLRYIERNGKLVLEKRLDDDSCSCDHKCWVPVPITRDETTPIEFKEGKFYKNRLGQKLFFLQNRNNTPDNCAYIFYNYDTGTKDWFTKNGSYYNDADPHENDIVADWEDKNE